MLTAAHHPRSMRRIRWSIAILSLLMLAHGGRHAGFGLWAAEQQSPRHLYVPAANLDALIHRDQGGVLLPKADFESLLEQARQAGELRSPETAVLTAANYVARLEGEQLVLTMEIQAQNFTGTWATLPIRIGGLGIESAAVGAEAAAVTRGDPPEVLHWLVRSKGTVTLTLQASLPLAAVGSDRVAAFDLPGAPAGELQITLPAGKHLQLGGISLQRPGVADAPATYRLAIGGQQSIELRITDRASQSQADVLTFASTAHGLSVAPGEVTWSARTSLQVIGRKIDQLVASVPRSLEITAVESAGLEAWELADDPADDTRTAITLRWRQPFDGTRTITFRGVVAQLQGGDWTAPNLRLAEVTSHTGVVEVQYPLGVRVTPRLVEGARATSGENSNAASLAPPAAGGAPGRLRFSAFAESFTLTFTTTAKARELHVAMTNLLDVTNDGLMLFTLVEPSPLFDSLFELQMALPAEWEVQELAVADTSVDWRIVPLAAGINELRVPLEPPLAPGQSRPVRLVARRLLENWPVEQTPVRFAIPEVQLPQANVVEAVYGVTGEEDLLLTPVEVTGLDPARRADLATLERQLAGKGRTLRLGFAYQDTTFSGQIEAVRKPTRISAATLTFVQLDRETVTSALETQVRISGGGAKELQVALPEAAGEDLRFDLTTPQILQLLRTASQQLAQQRTTQQQRPMIWPPLAGPRIVEQQAAPPVDGRRVWTLKLDRRLSGDAVISTEVRQPRGDATSFIPLVLDVVGAERQNGHIAVIAGDDQQVTLTATDAAGQALPLIDPVDFPASFTFPIEPLRSGRRRIVASVQYLQPGYSASLSDQRFAHTAVPTAVCREAKYATIVSRSGELQHEATLLLQAVGVQSLAVRLPEGNELWAALVDGAPVEVRVAHALSNGHALTLPLPPATHPDAERRVQLLYRSSVGRIASTGQLQQYPPQVTVITGQGTEQPLEVLRQAWTVHHSPDTLLLASDGQFHTPGPLYTGTFLSRLGDLWTLPTPREATQLAAIAGIGLLLVVVLVAGIRRFGWLPVLLLVAIPAVLIALMLPATRQVREAARKSEESERRHQLAVDAEIASSRDAYIASSGAVPAADAPAMGGLGRGGFGGGEFGVPGPAGGPMPPPAPAAMPAPAMEPPRDRAEVNSPARPLPALLESISDGATPAPASAANPTDARRAGARFYRENRPAEGRTQLGSGEAQGASAPSGGTELRSNSFHLADDQLQIPQIAQQALPNAPASPGTPQAGQEGFATRGRGALLSLALALAPPENFVSREFTYAGSETEPTAVNLEVTVADRRGSQMLLAVVAAGVLLLFWVLRKADLASRAGIAAGAIAGPLAASSLVPAALLIPLEGVLIGGLLGLLLWAVLGAARRCECGNLQAQMANLKSRYGRPRAAAGGTPGSGTPGSSGGAVASPPASLLLAVTAALACAAPSVAEDPPPRPEADRPVVIVPYDVGSDPLEADRVLVPREYFLKLWSAAHPEEQPGVRPPAAAVVAGALYQAELEPPAGDEVQGPAARERTVKVTARFVLQRLDDEPARVTLPLSPVAIESATLDDQPAALVVSADGAALDIVLRQAGLQVLDVVFRVPAVNVTDEAGKFTLPLRPTTTARLSFAVPGDASTEVRLNGSTEAYRFVAADGRRQLQAAVAAGGDVTVSWRPKASRVAGDGARQVESTIGATVDDAGLTVRHRFRYVVSQGALADVSFAVPAGVSVKRIAGADVAGWEHAVEGADRSLKVFLRRDVDDTTSLDIDLFQKLELGDDPTVVRLPTLIPQDATRETGDLAVFAEPQLAVATGATSGLRQVNVANFTMDSALTQPGATARFAFRFDARPFELPLSLSRRQPETRVVSEHGVQVQLRKLRVASRLVFDLREAPRANLSFVLPAGYLPLDVQGDYLSDWAVSDVEGRRVLTVELDQPRTGRVQVLLEGTQPRDATLSSVTIALPLPLEVNRQESQLGVWIDDAFTATAGVSADWRALDPAQLPETIRGLRSDAPQFGFRSTQPAPAAVPIELTRAVAELSGEAVILTAVSDAALDYGLNLRWRIDRAAADTFVVATPDWLGEQIEFTGEGIRQIQSAPVLNGVRVWTITLHEPARGQFLLSAVATLPLPANQLVRIPAVQFLSGTGDANVPPLPMQRRFLVLVNLSGVHRLAEEVGTTVDRVQRDQLPLQLPEKLLDQAVEIAALPLGQALPSWRLESTATNQEAAATVLLADLRTVIDHDGSWRTQADYRVRNRGRQFLAIVPPTDSRLLSVLVHERPSQAIQQDGGAGALLLVPLPATSIVDLSFTVRLVFAGRLPQSLPRGFVPAGRELTLPAPQVASKSQSPEYGLPVLQTLWRVDVPDDVLVSLVDESGRSNLLPGDDTAAEQAYGKAVLEDLKSQISLGWPSKSGRKSGIEGNRRSLAAAVQQVQQLNENQRRLVEQEGQLLQQAEQKLKELQVEADSAPGIVADESLSRNDFGRKYIADNNRDFLLFNGTAPATDLDTDSVLNFSRQLHVEESLEKKQLADQPAAKSRALVREQLQGQSLSYSNSAQVDLGDPAGVNRFPESSAYQFGGQMDNTQWAAPSLAAGAQESLDLAQAASPPVSSGLAHGGDWTEAGGLSLPLELPRTGRELTFTKVGGDPQLTLNVRPRETLTTGLGLLWGALCVAAAVIVVGSLTRGGLTRARLCWMGVLFGLSAAVLLPSPLRFAALVPFLVGAGCLLAHRIAIRQSVGSEAK